MSPEGQELYLKRLRMWFFINLGLWVLLSILLGLTNYVWAPSGFPWFIFWMLGWGIVVGFQAYRVFFLYPQLLRSANTAAYTPQGAYASPVGGSQPVAQPVAQPVPGSAPQNQGGYNRV
eukprot:CAMPEP_0113903224 /NCGR_PEP_ID=MMETSP0780_2-20120614/22374_1 /TAXON_ID=652834 /ORGANISM="Palpitomonas bilix" /LENGTH=118 /DNA_ID=CAMNT_0000896291 /DNA_START=53 /DNA_END=409 /DNA_ORIENTATION=+ /assembly_acc=CAM_ASM_000599